MSDEKKKVGRPPKQTLGSAAIPADSLKEGEDPRDPNKGKRPKRARIGRGDLKLDYPEHLLKRDEFRYHWALDDPARPGRIDGLIARGYDHVTEKGKKVTRPAGAATHFLMRLPMEYYLEDKADKKNKILAKSASHNKIGPNEYAPDPKTLEGDGGTSAVTKDNGSPYS